MSFSDQEVHAVVHRIFKALDYHEPYFSVSRIIENLYPELEVAPRAMREYARLDVYKEPLPSGKRAIVYYRENSHHSTHRFSVAHELAHWEFDCQRGAAIPLGAVCGGRAGAAKPVSERRADYFAAELLCPLWILDPMVDFKIHVDLDDDDGVTERDQRIQRLASRFNLSLACMKRRVFDLAGWRSMSRGR